MVIEKRNFHVTLPCIACFHFKLLSVLNFRDIKVVWLYFPKLGLVFENF